MPEFQQLIRERLRNCGLSPVREAEIVDELAQHLGERYRALQSGGASHEEAYATIVADLDGGELARALCGAEQPWNEPVALGAQLRGNFVAAFAQDLRYGLRVLRRNPTFTIISVLSLALGIGANTAIFQLFNAVRLRTLPVSHADELAIVRIADRHWAKGSFVGQGHFVGRDYSDLSYPLWDQIRQQQGFSGMFAWGSATLNLAAGGEARYSNALWVSGEFFRVLGVPPLLGRVFSASDDQPGCAASAAVISYSFWQREFGGDPAVIGRKLTLEGHPFEIVGVTPASFYGVVVGQSFDVAIPLCSEPLIRGENSFTPMRHGWWLAAMGRLKPGWTLEQATTQLAAISPGVMEATTPTVYDPEGVKHYQSYLLAAFPGANGYSALRRNYETPLTLLLAIAGLVLLIACANLANLMLARATAREREIAVRLALGAARERIIRQLLTESLLLALCGAALGAALASPLSSFLVRFLNSGNQRVFVDLATDWRVLGFAAALALLTCVLFGLAPALKATRASPARIMSSAGRSLTASREHFSLRRALVVAQVSLSLVLVVVALLFIRSLRNIVTLDAGFQHSGILLVKTDFTTLNLPKERRNLLREQMLERVRAVPGVEAAAETFFMPMSGSGWRDLVVVDGERRPQNVNMTSVSTGYFQTLGTPLLAGRDFDLRDTLKAPNVAIVNQQFARQIFGTDNAIGRRFQIDVYQGEKEKEYQVVGVVKDTKYFDLREDFGPIAFYPQAQEEILGTQTTILVRSCLPLAPLMGAVKDAIGEVSGSITINFNVFDTQIKDGLLRERLLATLSGFFGVLAGVLAMIGLYGVISYMVVRRTNEIGIRMALGAQPGAIVGMIVGEAARLLALGLLVGAVLAVAAGNVVSTLLFGLKPYDPLTVVLAAAGLAVVALAASLLPAQRAARLDPMVALREE